MCYFVRVLFCLRVPLPGRREDHGGHVPGADGGVPALSGQEGGGGSVRSHGDRGCAPGCEELHLSPQGEIPAFRSSVTLAASCLTNNAFVTETRE